MHDGLYEYVESKYETVNLCGHLTSNDNAYCICPGPHYLIIRPLTNLGVFLYYNLLQFS